MKKNVKMKAKRRVPSRKPASEVRQGAAGTYVYDPESARVVKVSSRIPGISSRSGGAGEDMPSGEAGPCGRTECSGGACAGESGDMD